MRRQSSRDPSAWDVNIPDGVMALIAAGNDTIPHRYYRIGRIHDRSPNSRHPHPRRAPAPSFNFFLFHENPHPEGPSPTRIYSNLRQPEVSPFHRLPLELSLHRLRPSLET